MRLEGPVARVGGMLFLMHRKI